MAIQRPLKTYGTRSYVAEVAAAPNNQDPILASEVDADLDTMYTAFNALVVNATIAATAPAAPIQGQLWWRNDPDGNLYISYNDGNSTQWVPAVPSSAPQWKVSGNALTPVDATKIIVAGTDPVGLRWGSGTVKQRLIDSSGSLQLASNFSGGVIDDQTRSQWALNMGPIGDSLEIFRSPAGATQAWISVFKVDNAGTVNIPGVANSMPLRLGSRAAKMTVLVDVAGGDWAGIALNQPFTPEVPASSSWFVSMTVGTGTNDNIAIYRRAPGAAGGSPGSSIANFYSDGNFQIYGSNGVKASGTTWINPSDIRLKRDVAPYAHGLADILQLEPISYTLKATDQQTCGLDAEKVRAVFPECVGTTRMKLQPEDEEETEVLTLDIHPILIALINAVRELNEKVS
jgi:hypothetical protein